MTVTRISKPVRIEAAGTPTKIISEFFGRVASSTESVSIAIMESPSGWAEPGQTPEFDEFTLVLDGEVVVEAGNETIAVSAGEAVHVPAGSHTVIFVNGTTRKTSSVLVTAGQTKTVAIRF